MESSDSNSVDKTPEQIAAALIEKGVIIRRGKSGSVLSIDFRPNTEAIGAVSLHWLLKFEKLRELYLDGCSIDRSELPCLRDLKKLQTLDLQNTSAGDPFLEQIADHPALKLLLLTGCDVSKESLATARKKMIGARVIFLT